VLLAEMDVHKDAWPFRTAVDGRTCPLYKRVIKRPMDMATIRHKLADHKYDVESEFVDDVRLIFDNCRTFNEDNSPIGKAGVTMRRYFQRRWRELHERTHITNKRQSREARAKNKTDDSTPTDTPVAAVS